MEIYYSEFVTFLLMGGPEILMENNDTFKRKTLSLTCTFVLICDVSNCFFMAESSSKKCRSFLFMINTFEFLWL